MEALEIFFFDIAKNSSDKNYLVLSFLVFFMPFKSMKPEQMDPTSTNFHAQTYYFSDFW